jgi:cytochrome b subunit of formate dehydrogenase/uncharacterized protein YlaI
MKCHGTKEIIHLSPEERAFQVKGVPWSKELGQKYSNKFSNLSIFLDEKSFRESVHGEIGLKCISCHNDIDRLPHRKRLRSVNCILCHKEQGEELSKSIHGKALSIGAKDAPLCQDCHGRHDIKRADDVKSRVHPLNQGKTCGQCHDDQQLIAKYSFTVRRPKLAYEGSVHANAIKNRNYNSATCSNCHGSHKILPASDPESTVSRLNESNTCGYCHNEERKSFQESVHWRAIKKGNLDSPSCSGCHLEHEILSTADPDSPVYARNISSITCSQCHDAERINRRYGLPSDRVKTYKETYHGLADMFGDTTVANCASCHGTHDIKPSSDPQSKINPENLVKTCGKCHIGATKRFVTIPVHSSPSIHSPVNGERVQYWVRAIYFVLIPLVIGFMLFHNILDYFKKIRRHYIVCKDSAKYMRMSLNERIQHIVIIVTFVILALTGFSLKFHWGLPFFGGELNQKMRFYIHRVAGAIFIFYFTYHFLWLIFFKGGRRWIKDMIPRFSDLRHLSGNLIYNLGLKKIRLEPQGRFSYIEKIEYWAFIWGANLMIFTGLILWFEKEAVAILPPWVFNGANIIHYYEAILATFSLLVWHLYWVIINPDVAPMAMQWLTGRVPNKGDDFDKNPGPK